MADIKVVEFNKVLISGRLTRDPELRYTPAGVAVTTLRLAVNTTFHPKDGDKREEVCYIDVTCWHRQAETAVEYLHKGSPVFVEGRLQSRSWETQDGQKRSIIEVQSDRVQFLEWADKGGEEAKPEGPGTPLPQDSPTDPDDIPF